MQTVELVARTVSGAVLVGVALVSTTVPVVGGLLLAGFGTSISATGNWLVGLPVSLLGVFLLLVGKAVGRTVTPQ